ncbi:UNVERIFIED_CONTAM: hypothetical protein K2H54_039683 [Gekko kuhli]
MLMSCTSFYEITPGGECPFTCLLLSALEYLLSLAQASLVVSLVKTHIAAIAMFHEEVQKSIVFAQKLAQRFLKGLSSVFLPAPLYCATVVITVLASLMKPSFELLASCSFFLCAH